MNRQEVWRDYWAAVHDDTMEFLAQKNMLSSQRFHEMGRRIIEVSELLELDAAQVKKLIEDTARKAKYRVPTLTDAIKVANKFPSMDSLPSSIQGKNISVSKLRALLTK